MLRKYQVYYLDYEKMIGLKIYWKLLKIGYNDQKWLWFDDYWCNQMLKLIILHEKYEKWLIQWIGYKKII